MEQVEKVESKIVTLRNQQVILDCDVAELYGVQTKRINETVKNNPDKPPRRVFREDLFNKETRTPIAGFYCRMHIRYHQRQ